eukprot:TRINITY_DN23332_c0_g2_i1.p1 TRINITY_DN23332_c0_g2~~TRINITY_DN23332_c0_g2_i1.p1  ORF type:complete len:1909 (-),score=337.49 TRINITY_DN23332_c0_g2_i1:271-5997(-)
MLIQWLQLFKPTLEGQVPPMWQPMELWKQSRQWQWWQQGHAEQPEVATAEVTLQDPDSVVGRLLEQREDMDGQSWELIIPVVVRAMERVEAIHGNRGGGEYGWKPTLLRPQAAVPGHHRQRCHGEGREPQEGAECKEGSLDSLEERPTRGRRGDCQSQRSHRQTRRGPSSPTPSTTAHQDNGKQAQKVKGAFGASEDPLQGGDRGSHRRACHAQVHLPDSLQHDEGDGAPKEGGRREEEGTDDESHSSEACILSELLWSRCERDVSRWADVSTCATVCQGDWKHSFAWTSWRRHAPAGHRHGGNAGSREQTYRGCEEDAEGARHRDGETTTRASRDAHAENEAHREDAARRAAACRCCKWRDDPKELRGQGAEHRRPGRHDGCRGTGRPIEDSCTRRRSRRRGGDRAPSQEGTHRRVDPFGRGSAGDRRTLTRSSIGVPPAPGQAEFKGPMRLYDRTDNLKLKECTLQALHDLQHAGYMQVDVDPVAVHVYTDGSSADDSGWAMVVLFDDCARRVVDGDKDRIHDRLYGFTGGNIGDGHDNYDAEVYAILYACRWIRRFDQTRRQASQGWSNIKYYIHSDCKPALSVIEGRSAMVNTNKPAAMLSYEFKTREVEIEHNWIKGHNNMPWNEMADVVANHAREFPASYPNHAKHIQHLETDEFITRRYVLERGRMGDTRFPEVSTEPKQIEAPHERLTSQGLAGSYMRTTVSHIKGKGEAAVNSITFMTFNALTLLRKGRTQTLKSQMSKSGVHIAGLQETRIRKAGRGECDDFHYINGARSSTSANHGCSVWIKKKIGKATIERHHIRLVVEKPRVLIVAVRCSALHALLISAHAPHAGHTAEEVEAFWEDLKADVVKINTAMLPIVVMADMNCQPCPMDGRVGRLAEGEKMVTTEHASMKFIQEMDMCIPHTYAEYNMQGMLTTTCYAGGESKIDYVIMPSSWLTSTGKTTVHTDVDPTLGRLDHCPVSTTVCRPMTTGKMIKGRHSLPYDIAQAKNEKNAEIVKDIMRDAPQPDWQVDQDTHIHMVNQHMVARLTECFPKSKRKRRPEWMASTTIKLIEEKHDCFKKLVRLRRQHGHDDAEREELETKLKGLNKQVAKAVGKDREKQIDELAQKCDAQFSMNDTHHAYKTLKRLRPYQPRPVEILHTAEGMPVLDQQQAEEEWGRRWKNLLQGEDTSFQQLFEAADEAPMQESDKKFDVSLYIPTHEEITRHIITAKAGKMHGNDLLPIDVWKIAPTMAADIMVPIHMKILATMRWPVAWKGDTHQAIPKAAGKFRGICLADSSGKLLSRSMRSHVIDEVQSKAPDLTCGGVQKRGADMAAHALDQAHQFRGRKHKSHAFLFIDVVSAFDNVNRALLAEAGSGTLIGEVINAMHSDTWTTTQFTDKVYKTKRGVKQGDPVSDAAFLLIFVDALNVMRLKLSEAGLSSIITVGRQPARGSENIQDVSEIQEMVEVSYMDDIVLAIPETGKETILQDAAEAMKIAEDTLQEYDFECNLAKGKTNLVVHTRTKAIRDTIRNTGAKLNYSGDRYLEIVEDYKHVGVMHSSTSGGQKRVAGFVNKIKRGLQDHAAIFRSKFISIKHKEKAADIVVAAAMYGTHVWEPPTESQLNRMTKAYNMLMRAAGGLKYRKDREDLAVNDGDMLRMTGKVPLRVLIRLRRLQYYARLVNNSPSTLRGLIAQNQDHDNSWAKQLISDMQWAKSWSTKLEKMDDPAKDMTSWQELVQCYPAQWKTILRGIMKDAQAGLVTDYEDSEKRKMQRDHVCITCQRVFKDAQALHLHAHQKHKRRSAVTRFAAAKKCGWCGKKYSSRYLLKRHLATGWKRRGPGSCMGQLKLHKSKELDEDEIKAIDEEERFERRKEKAAGMPLGGGSKGYEKEAGMIDHEGIIMGPLPQQMYVTCDAIITTDMQV